MKTKINGYEVEGSVDEIRELLRLGTQEKRTETPKKVKPKRTRMRRPKRVPWTKILGKPLKDRIKSLEAQGKTQREIRAVVKQEARDAGYQVSNRKLKDAVKLARRRNGRSASAPKQGRKMSNWEAVLGMNAVEFAKVRLGQGKEPLEIVNELERKGTTAGLGKRGTLRNRAWGIVTHAKNQTKKKVKSESVYDIAQDDDRALGNTANFR